MPYQDLREFVAFLESQGDLRRVSAPVDPELEITEIAHRMLRADGPALLFENVVGHDMPVLINLFCSDRRMNWALDVNSPDELAARLESMIDLVQGGPPPGIVNKLRTLGRLVHVGSYQPRSITNAPCQEIVLTGEDVNLYDLPIIKCWPEDAAPFITLPLVITKDPETGTQNYGIYRMQVFGQNPQGRGPSLPFQRRTRRRPAGKWPSPWAGDPASIWTGSAPLPPDVDEMVPGRFRPRPGRGAHPRQVGGPHGAGPRRDRTGRLRYPRRERVEGPFAAIPGYYSLAEPYPVFHVTTLTRRRNPIYPTTFVGRPPPRITGWARSPSACFCP